MSKCILCSTNIMIEKIKNISFLSCQKCGLLFREKFIKYGAISSKWGKGNEILKNYLEGLDWRLKIFEDRANLLVALNSSLKTVLDIGSAAGLFIYVLRKKGILVEGVEPFEPFYQFSKILNPEVSHYEHLWEIKKTFDIITCWDTINFFDKESFLWFVANIKDLINKEGFLIISSVFIDDGFDLIDEVAFNFFFKLSFWRSTIPSISGLSLYKLWIECKNLNTKELRSVNYWKEFLELSPCKKMVYIIYKNKR